MSKIRWQVFEKQRKPEGGFVRHDFAAQQRAAMKKKVQELKAADNYESTWDCHNNPVSDMFKL